MQVRFHINAAALPPLRHLALALGIECEDASELLKRYLHALADVPLPVKGGSVKGRALNITDEERDARSLRATLNRQKLTEARRRRAAEARAAKKQENANRTDSNAANNSLNTPTRSTATT